MHAGLRGAEREQRPEIDRMRQRQVRLAAAERQIDLRGGGQHREPEQDGEQRGVIQLQHHRREHQADAARQHHGGDVGTRGGGQVGERGRLVAALHYALPSCSQSIRRSVGR